jgi:hypothetical protein
MKSDGVKEYKIYDIQPIDAKGIRRRRFMCLNFFIPMFALIPAFIESGVFYSYYAHKASSVIGLLQICDLYFFVYGLTMYNIINKTVTLIVYNVEENTFTVKQLGTWNLKERTFTFKPDELVKHYRKSMNPFIGYRSRR